MVCGGISFYPHARPGAEGVPTSSSGLRVQGCQCTTLSPQLLLLASKTARRSAISAPTCNRRIKGVLLMSQCKLTRAALQRPRSTWTSGVKTNPERSGHVGPPSPPPLPRPVSPAPPAPSDREGTWARRRWTGSGRERETPTSPTEEMAEPAATSVVELAPTQNFVCLAVTQQTAALPA